MKEKVKTIFIIILSVLLAMSIFLMVLFGSLLQINSVASLKRVMLASEALASYESTEQKPVTEPEGSANKTPMSTESTTPTPAPADKATLLNAAGIRITLLDIEYDTFWESYKLKLSIENTSNTNIIVTSAEETIDGYMVDTSIGFYCEVLAGKKAIDYMTLYSFDLEPMGITKPNKIEFKLNVADSDDIFTDIVSSGKITVSIP